MSSRTDQTSRGAGIHQSCKLINHTPHPAIIRRRPQPQKWISRHPTGQPACASENVCAISKPRITLRRQWHTLPALRSSRWRVRQRIYAKNMLTNGSCWADTIRRTFCAVRPNSTNSTSRRPVVALLQKLAVELEIIKSTYYGGLYLPRTHFCFPIKVVIHAYIAAVFITFFINLTDKSDGSGTNYGQHSGHTAADRTQNNRKILFKWHALRPEWWNKFYETARSIDAEKGDCAKSSKSLFFNRFLWNPLDILNCSRNMPQWHTGLFHSKITATELCPRKTPTDTGACV